MRDAKDHTTLELPGLDLTEPAPTTILTERKYGLRGNARSKVPAHSQLDLLAPLGQTDHTGLPAWTYDANLDHSGLPIWATS